MFQRQVATAFHFVILTFMLCADETGGEDVQLISPFMHGVFSKMVGFVCL